MRARAPGSTSNLGPGFDVLGLALARYTEVEVVASPSLVVHADGEGSALPRDASHLAVRVVAAVLGHDHVEVSVSSDVPPGRGLGSSGALALAAAAAAGASDPLAVAARFDGHAENAAASFHGGLVAATLVDDEVVARPLPLDDELGFVVVVPDRELETKTARGVLPATVAFGDATFNLGRMGLLLAGLADAASLVPEAGDDRLYVGARTTLYPEAPALLAAIRAAGAVVACWSGAGPSLLGICRTGAAADEAATALRPALGAVGLTGQVVALRPDRAGLQIFD